MPSPNQRLGEYILLERIGAGAFGDVWRACHHIWSERLFAIKIPTDPSFVRQLQREGTAIQRLDHPGIVKPISFDPFSDPPYLVMELVTGGNLRQVIHRAPVAADTAVAIVRQILEALEHAHSHGVIHRDVKPENVLIDSAIATKSGIAAAGAVRITDFGLGKVAEQLSPQSIMLSMTSTQQSVVGTTRYMAPEQLDGAEVDATADVYACGVILFELLTGRRPAGFELPSELNPDVPPELDEAFRGAFARRERRYPSAKAFSEVLMNAVDTGNSPSSWPTAGEVGPLAPIYTAPARKKPRETGKGTLLVGGIVAVGFIAGAFTWALWSRHARPMGVSRPESTQYLEIQPNEIRLSEEMIAPATRPRWRRLFDEPQPASQPAFPATLPVPGFYLGAGSDASVSKPQIPASQPDSDLPAIEVVNEAGVAEAGAIAAEVGIYYPAVVPPGTKLTLLKTHDATSMRRHAGAPAAVRDAYSKFQIIGRNNFIMLWGVYERWPKGKYLVVYRVRAVGDLGDRTNVAFLDVCRDGNTVAEHRPRGRELPKDQWRSIPVELTLPDDTTVEYRLWPHGNEMVVDRLYIFRVAP